MFVDGGEDSEVRSGGSPEGVRSLVALARAVAIQDVSGLEAEGLAERVVEVAEAADRIDAGLLGAVAAVLARGGIPDGSRSLVGWLVRSTGLDRPEAQRVVRTARLLADHHRLANALTAGDVTARKVRVLAEVVIPDRRQLFARDVDVLTDAAVAVSADELRLVCRRWASYADDELGRGEPGRIHDNRGVWERRFGGLGELTVRGPQVDVAALLAALDRLNPPDGAAVPGGPRSLAQRRYDSLMALTRRGRADGHDPEHTVNIVIDWDSLAGGFEPEGRSETLDGTPIDPVTVGRLLCDSWLARVICSADGEVLDLGRRTRLFSAGQRKALLLEHGGCAVCGAPPEWCDIHHLDPWHADGETNKSNGLPLCRNDHTRVHEHGWTLRRTPDGRWTLEPP